MLMGLLTDDAVCKNCKAKGRTPELYQKHVRMLHVAHIRLTDTFVIAVDLDDSC
jgi:hypothetical protein